MSIDAMGKVELSRSSAIMNGLERARQQYSRNVFSIETPKETTEITAEQKRERERLRTVSEDFEALMINQMLKEMRKTVNKTKLVDGGMAEEIFEDMLYDEYAKEFSKSKSFGLAETIYNQMERYI